MRLVKIMCSWKLETFLSANMKPIERVDMITLKQINSYFNHL